MYPTDTSSGGNSSTPPLGGEATAGIDNKSLLDLISQLISAPQGDVLGNPQRAKDAASAEQAKQMLLQFLAQFAQSRSGPIPHGRP